MSSPDISTYVDLTLYDADPSTLVNRMIVNSQLLLPGWTAEAGLPEVTIAQGLALEIAELVFAVNRLPSATVQALLQLFGVTRNPGTAAGGSVTFTTSGLTATTVPAGTELQLQLGSQSYLFTTNTSLTVAAGTTSGTVAVTCSIPAAAPNGTAAGTALTVLGVLPAVNTAVMAATVAGGADPETVPAWLNRGSQTLQTLSSALTLPAQFTPAALAVAGAGVYRAHTTSNWNPTLSGGTGGASQGCVTVSVLGEGGAVLSAAAITSVQTALTAQAAAGLAVFVAAANVTTVPVTCTVWQEPGYTVSQVQANIAASLAAPLSSGGAGLSTDLWPFTNPNGALNSTVRLNDLIAVITQTAGVAFVVSMAAPAGDVQLPGVAPLAELGTVTVAVEGP
jgi:uncharacterized phage protein gp47/JayE